MPESFPRPPLVALVLAGHLARFVKMRVPQWREDVLGWAAKQGYKETGGGVWGELDGESAEDLTRPTRYFVLTVNERKKNELEDLLHTVYNYRPLYLVFARRQQVDWLLTYI